MCDIEREIEIAKELFPKLISKENNNNRMSQDPKVVKFTVEILGEKEFFLANRNLETKNSRTRFVNALNVVLPYLDAVCAYRRRTLYGDSSSSGEKIMSWGKHKGKKMSDVPDGYIIWCMNAPNIPEGVKASLWRRLSKERQLELSEELQSTESNSD